MDFDYLIYSIFSILGQHTMSALVNLKKKKMKEKEKNLIQGIYGSGNGFAKRYTQEQNVSCDLLLLRFTLNGHKVTRKSSGKRNEQTKNRFIKGRTSSSVQMHITFNDLYSAQMNKCTQIKFFEKIRTWFRTNIINIIER